jgi:hypothetical protein
MKHWANIGTGPWFYIPRYPLPKLTYKGVEGPAPDLAIALAYSGGLQIELIQQKCETPSMYKEFLDAGLEGLQHHAVFLENYDEVLQEALEKGYTVGQAGDAVGRGRFAYLESEGHPGTVVELVELTEARKAGFVKMKKEAESWDGEGPVRLL